MKDLERIAERIRQDLEAKNEAREKALERSRRLTQRCALCIRAVHRGQSKEAAQLLAMAKEIAAELKEIVADYPDLYHAGYTQDALKELAEAAITYALVNDKSLPTPDELGVEYAAYLNGLGEVVGELRRYVLDLIRQGCLKRGEEVLSIMDDIYGVLVTIDFPEAITGGLRRTTDMVRGVVERTRGDLTVAIRQEKLREALREFERKMG